MQKHNNYNKEEPLMPTKKSDSKSEPTKAVVSKLGVNDEPTATKSKVVETKNGRTLTYN